MMVCAERREPLIPAETPDCSPCACFQVVLNRGREGGGKKRPRLLWMHSSGEGWGKGWGSVKCKAEVVSQVDGVQFLPALIL